MLEKLTRIFRKPKGKNDSNGYTCATCGKFHAGLPMDLGLDAPYYWDAEQEKHNPNSELTTDTCIIDNKDFFIKVILEIPVIDGPTPFRYGVWVSLSEQNFKRYLEVYGTKKELDEPLYFGWFSNWLKGYEPKTIEMKTNIHLQGNETRPFIELEHSGHPLAKEYYHGITMHRVQEILEINGILKSS